MMGFTMEFGSIPNQLFFDLAFLCIRMGYCTSFAALKEDKTIPENSFIYFSSSTPESVESAPFVGLLSI